MKSTFASALVMGLLAGCAPPPAGLPQLAGDIRFLPSLSDYGVGVHRSSLTHGDGPNGAHIIFLNFDGATLKAPVKGFDNAASNESWIAGNVSFPAFNAAPYAPAYTRDGAISAIANIFKNIYAPFNVMVVTARPTAGQNYTMCMIGGQPEVIGEGQGVAGVAPLDCDNDNEGDVSFAFADDLSPDNTGSSSASMKAIASTAAQETAHSFGLGHTQSKTDIMYPQLLPGQNAFGGLSNIQPDGSGKCGNGKTQDSTGMLKMVVGAAGGTMTGPTPQVVFVAPKNGDIVPLDFTILVSAVELGGTIARVEVSSGNQQLFTSTTPPYKESETADQSGTYELTATAYDTNGNFQSTTITFTAKKGAPPQVIGCKTKDDCDTGLICDGGGQCALPGNTPSCSAATPCPNGFICQVDGSCSPTMSAPKPGEIGAACADQGQCKSGICGSFNGSQLCTAVCDPNAQNTCPGSLSCRSSGPIFVCTPNASSGGSGCSAAPTAAPTPLAAPLLFLLLTAAIALRLRRRA